MLGQKTQKHNSQSLPPFIIAMMKPEFYNHPVQHCQLIETHISWVLLTGDFVYKVKKPVNFGFLDFSTLEKRKFYCEEELRLNRRLAPEIYLDVVQISGSQEHPVLDGSDKPFEFAIKMLQFSQDKQLDHMLDRNELKQDMIDAIAIMIADFHQQLDSAKETLAYGDPEQIYHPVKENFIQIRKCITNETKLDLVTELEQWSQNYFNKITNIITQRKKKGFIRECHGDLHLRNIAWYKNKPLIFDCLEFNPEFRWIDVISEIAFLVMDLQDHHQAEFAQRFLNHYLEITGDYEGCCLLHFYLVYRAMVRAKVDAIRASQAGISKKEQDEASGESYSYLQLALTYTKRQTPFIIITHGKSASGKSTITQPLLEKLGAIRIRSDVERKRLYNIKPGGNSTTHSDKEIYTSEATKKTYHKLLKLAEVIINASFPVIVDATFSTAEQRNLFQNLATQKQVRFVILDFLATDETLKQRIRDRQQDVSDADINVLENQIKNWQPLKEDEKINSISINTEEELNIDGLISRLMQV